jgi:hypothetical protein
MTVSGRTKVLVSDCGPGLAEQCGRLSRPPLLQTSESRSRKIEAKQRQAMVVLRERGLIVTFHG